MRKYLPFLALFIIYATVNLMWQWQLANEIRRLRAESVQQDQMRAWVEHLARDNDAALEVPEF